MKIEAVAFEMNLTDIERNLLQNKIEFWFTGSYQSRERLFGDVDKSIQLLEIAKQIKGNAISIRISRYQAEIISDMIYHLECRMNPKTSKVYLPEDFPLRNLYNELIDIAKWA